MLLCMPLFAQRAKKREINWDELRFQWYYKFNLQPKYPGKINGDTEGNMNWLQFDTSRIYVVRGRNRKYFSLFQYGIVYPNLLYCALDSNCSTNDYFNPADTVGFSTFWASLTYKNYVRYFSSGNWRGHFITVTSINSIVSPDAQKRRFRIVCSNGRGDGTTGDIIILEIYNRGAHWYTGRRRFIKGSSVSFIKHVRVQI